MSARGIGAAVVSYGLWGCGSSEKEASVYASFLHGVASGDPLYDAVILWTQTTPVQLGLVLVVLAADTHNAWAND
ncbi:MAG: hypothetical protein LPD71_04930 [Shewanella sp.]|nr:hypothetical protein [Shewanella sp.]MCF1430948.1 hypothetical protein [Shewanella sp.]MCF1438108.1 hypothetical protein [Shewanella sp.]MCF1458132.1 hypothetical protein [Shewanella sp.]